MHPMAISKNMKLLYATALIALCLNIAGCSKHTGPPSETEYQQWQKDPENVKNAAELENYLTRQGIAGVFPIQQLLRSDVKWRACKAEPFIVPPKKYWPHIGRILRVIKNEIIPLVGPVEALSVYREPKINRCVRGAKQSFHLKFHAIDMKTQKPISRQLMIEKLCELHTKKGKSLNMGLGIYKGQRFHIDAAGFRSWGHDFKSSSSPCR
jgi:hypothetical protein